MPGRKSLTELEQLIEENSGYGAEKFYNKHIKKTPAEEAGEFVANVNNLYEKHLSLIVKLIELHKSKEEVDVHTRNELIEEFFPIYTKLNFANTALEYGFYKMPTKYKEHVHNICQTIEDDLSEIGLKEKIEEQKALTKIFSEEIKEKISYSFEDVLKAALERIPRGRERIAQKAIEEYQQIQQQDPVYDDIENHLLNLPEDEDQWSVFYNEDQKKSLLNLDLKGKNLKIIHKDFLEQKDCFEELGDYTRTLTDGDLLLEEISENITHVYMVGAKEVVQINKSLKEIEEDQKLEEENSIENNIRDMFCACEFLDEYETKKACHHAKETPKGWY